MRWSLEDTLKLLGLTLFIGSFVIVIQQLLSADAKVNAKEAVSITVLRKKEE